MAATLADRSSLAPQRCSEPIVSVARPMLVTIEALRTHLPAREAVKLRKGNLWPTSVGRRVTRVLFAPAGL